MHHSWLNFLYNRLFSCEIFVWNSIIRISVIADILKHDTYFRHQTHQQNGQILRPGDVLVLPRNLHQNSWINITFTKRDKVLQFNLVLNLDMTMHISSYHSSSPFRYSVSFFLSSLTFFPYDSQEELVQSKPQRLRYPQKVWSLWFQNTLHTFMHTCIITCIVHTYMHTCVHNIHTFIYLCFWSTESVIVAISKHNAYIHAYLHHYYIHKSYIFDSLMHIKFDYCDRGTHCIHSFVHAYLIPWFLVLFICFNGASFFTSLIASLHGQLVYVLLWFICFVHYVFLCLVICCFLDFMFRSLLALLLFFWGKNPFLLLLICLLL